MKLATGGLAALGAVAAASTAQPPAARSAEVRNLIAVLQRPGASLHERARACQQLGEFGTREAVPALAALLSDEVLSTYARSGLEGIPDPSAAEALRSALTRLKGNLLVGVVNSLGVLRDQGAVGALGRLAGDPASGAAKHALLALGRISNAEAIAMLRRALSAGPAALRPDAAAACLIAAEFQLAAGHAQTAVSLYDAVRAADVPSPYRNGAVRGAILARESGGIALLVKLLRSDDRETRNVALQTIREIPGEKLAEALNAEMESAKPELQAQLIEAMADCHNARSLGAVRAKAASANPMIRQAALRTLGKIGGPGEAGILLKTLRDSRDSTETAIASAGLARIEGTQVDAMILEALAAAADAETRVRLIELLDARSPAGATRELLKQAADPDPKVGLAAYRAIRSRAGLAEVPPLIALTKTCKDGARRAAAENALYYACARPADVEAAGALVLAELERATEDLDKGSWIKTLAAIGYNKAVPAVAASLRDPNPWLVTTALESLGKWPNPAPIGELFRAAETSANPNTRAAAYAAAIQLATAAGNARQAPDAAVRAWFERAGKLARSVKDKRAVVTALGRWTQMESVRLLETYLDDPDTKAAAAYAIVNAAAPLAAEPGGAALKPVLERISATKDPSLLERIQMLRLALAAAEAAAKGRP